MKKMKRVVLLICSLVFPIILGNISFHPIPTMATDAISISYPNLTQNINSVPTTFQDDEFKFAIHNIASTPTLVKAYGEVLRAEEWQDQFVIEWVTNNIELAPDEIYYFQPIVHILTDIGYEYAVHFVFEAWTVQNNNDSGNKLVGAVGGTAKFIVFSAQEGAQLQIRTTDQNNVERLADVRIYYGGLDSQGWAIQKSFTDSYYTDIVKQGYYWVIATDKDFGLEKQAKPFPVFNDTEIQLVFDLLSFPQMDVIAPETRNGQMIINYTLRNYYPSLSNVYYQIRLEQGNETLLLYENDFAKFQQGIHRDFFKWNHTWENTIYYVSSQIWVNGKLYHNESQIVEMNFPNRIKLQLPNINLESLVYGLGLIFFGGFTQWAIFRVVKKKKLPKESNKNEITT